MYKADFPIFANHPDLVYLDTAASAQKPEAVIQAVAEFSRTSYANIHRGLYPLSLEATQRYEEARETVAHFIGADKQEIVFTRNGTEALNLLADTLCRNLNPGDEIIVSELEHHANLVPWQQAAKRQNLALRLIKITPTGEIDLENFRSLINPKTRVVSLAHCSNVLGSIVSFPDLKKIVSEQGSDALLIADACQSVPHLPVSVSDLQVDFLAFSGHKLYGPSGIGVLWGKKPLLASLPPYQTGGDMVETVTPTDATWEAVPGKFEAGTPNLEGAVGLAAAIKYLEGIGMENVVAHTRSLMGKALPALHAIPQVKIVGQPRPESGIIAFTIQGIHPHDVAEMLGEQQVCVRAGQHCAMPLHTQLGIGASVRASFGIYNDEADIEKFLKALEEIIRFFHV